MKSITQPFAFFALTLAATLISEPTPCSAWTGFPGSRYEGWPKIVKDLSNTEARYENFRISISPAADQSAGGTGGGIADIKIRDVVSGKVLQIETQCIDVRILEKYQGFPQIEIWGRGGGGSYSRRLYRVEHGEYRAIRDDLFDANINQAVRKDVISSVPGYADIVYYTGTMYPQEGDE